MTSLKTSIKTITYLSDTGCLEIQGASLMPIFSVLAVSRTPAPLKAISVISSLMPGLRAS
ncbi:nitrite extrusion 2 domain protein [Shigella dysenteriae 1617]|nr:nitrite extrusion 2 domain protein [Shigella dysenteriae 1617]